jgi:hypothetical protein
MLRRHLWCTDRRCRACPGYQNYLSLRANTCREACTPAAAQIVRCGRRRQWRVGSGAASLVAVSTPVLASSITTTSATNRSVRSWPRFSAAAFSHRELTTVLTTTIEFVSCLVAHPPVPTDQKVRGSNPFGRTQNQGSDQLRSGSEPSSFQRSFWWVSRCLSQLLPLAAHCRLSLPAQPGSH